MINVKAPVSVVKDLLFFYKVGLKDNKFWYRIRGGQKNTTIVVPSRFEGNLKNFLEINAFELNN